MNERDRLRAKLQALNELKAKQEAAKLTQAQHELKHIDIAPKQQFIPQSPIANKLKVTLNEEQLLAAQYAREKKSFCLIGPAGSGKTTALKAVVAECLEGLDVEQLIANKQQPVVLVSFTRRAVRNAANALKEIGAEQLCKTAHSFLEYMPTKEDYIDENGDVSQRFTFVPQRTKNNPISECKIVIIEEASMMSYQDLYAKLVEACPNAIFIFVGDLNQLPPIFGDAVLGYKLVELPVIELTKIYRQAMDSPIIAFQHNFTLKHYPPTENDLVKISSTATADSGLEFVPWKKDVAHGDAMADAVVAYMLKHYAAGTYNPMEDTILCPFRKTFGITHMNLGFAQKFGDLRKAEVWEIIAGRETKYLAVGDYVIWEKNEYIIEHIMDNHKYIGKTPKQPSVNLTRTGLMKGSSVNLGDDIKFHDMDFEKLLNGTEDEVEEATRASSAIVTLKDTQTGKRVELSSIGQVGKINWAYALTIHESQGSEWRKVWLVAHNFHSNMLSRELLYTGMTRAREKLTVIYSPQKGVGILNSSIAKAIKKGEIPGRTWRDKAEHFKGKLRGTQRVD